MIRSVRPTRRMVPSLFGLPIRIGEEVSTLIARHEILAVTIPLIVFATLSIWDSTLYPFWFDELFSFNIAHLPTIHDALHAMPADGQPPLHYAVIRLTGALSGAVRLPPGSIPRLLLRLPLSRPM